MFVDGNVLTVKVGRDLHHELRETALQNHRDVLVAVCMEECAGDVEASDVAAFVCVDDGGEEHRLRRDCRRCRFLLGPVVALFAAIGTESCFDGLIALLLQEH